MQSFSSNGSERGIMKTKRLTNLEIASFCEQMSMIMKAGITPKDGLAILLSDTKDASTQEILKELLKTASLGETFTNSIKSSNVFPEYVENMIAIGEETGKLDEVMQSLSDYYEHEESVSESVRNALTYPFIMILLMLVIIVVIISKVLPLFNQVFIQLGTELNGLSASLLHIGDVIQSYSLVFFGIIFLLLIAYVYITKTNSGKAIFAKFCSSFGPTKQFYSNIAYGRFASGMSLMLNSGMGIYQSLEMVKHLVDYPDMEEKIENCKQDIMNGDNFSEALLKEGIFNNLYSRMVAIAVKTGDTDSVLGKIATIYDEETDKKIRSFIAIIEPTLVISLSLIVGLILLSVILPLLGIMTSIG